MSPKLTTPSLELAAEQSSHNSTKRKPLALRARERVRERRIKHLKFLVRRKQYTSQIERNAHRSTLQKLHVKQENNLDLTFELAIIKNRLRMRRRGEKNFERLKAAYLALQSRYEGAMEENVMLEGELRILEEEVVVLREREVESGGGCNVV